uniref:Uncharacterized protein n=1 Tax=Oryza brachyantha TaxID=4533 RepID=J3MBB1_ORYBR
MMSTDSVFALQVAPSSDFTGFFLAHPELMDLAASTTPRASSVAAADERAHSTQFDSIPELGEATMQLQGHYSFAFPTLIEVKRHSSKNPQEVHPRAAPTTMVAVAAAAEPAPAPAKAEMSSKPEEAPRKVASKGGWLPCFPCC